MEGHVGGGIPAGVPYPKLLDLIVVGSSERGRRDGGGGRNVLGAEEKQKLELRLGLPGSGDQREVKEEDKGGSSLGFHPTPVKCNVHTYAGAKRGFMDTFGHEIGGVQQHQTQKPSFLRFTSTPQTVRAASRQANGTITEQDQRQKGLEKQAGPPASAVSTISTAVASSKNSQPRIAPAPVVGWPPIRSFRKNLASSTSEPQHGQPESGLKPESQEICNSNKGMFVKINMDGIPIGRKVNLNACESYEKLSSAVDELFRVLLATQREAPALGIGREGQGTAGRTIAGLLDGSGEFTLVYEDAEGDVLLVGDVPWNMFVSAVKRLRVMKTADLSSLSLTAGNRNRTSASEAAIR